MANGALTGRLSLNASTRRRSDRVKFGTSAPGGESGLRHGHHAVHVRHTAGPDTRSSSRVVLCYTAVGRFFGGRGWPGGAFLGGQRQSSSRLRVEVRPLQLRNRFVEDELNCRNALRGRTRPIQRSWARVARSFAQIHSCLGFQPPLIPKSTKEFTLQNTRSFPCFNGPTEV